MLFIGDEVNGLFGVKYGDFVFFRKIECIDWFVGDKFVFFVWFFLLLFFVDFISGFFLYCIVEINVIRISICGYVL